jgi:hypothetical protein
VTVPYLASFELDFPAGGHDVAAAKPHEAIAIDPEINGTLEMCDVRSVVNVVAAVRRRS